MSQHDEQASHQSWLKRWGSMLNPLRGTKGRPASPTTAEEPRENGSASYSQPPPPQASPPKPSPSKSSPPQASPALRIARYSLVLMDPEGQVVWTGDWDSGGVFEFGPHQHLWVVCGFTNHTKRETEIAEYEVELMGEDGKVVERFGESFGDAVIIPPGESIQFPAEWRM